MNFDDLRKELEALLLPRGSYVIVGSGSLAVRGIREAQDLDIVVTEKEFKRLLKAYPQDTKNHPNNCLVIGNLELGVTWQASKELSSQLLKEAEIISGLAFIPLSTLIAWKQKSNREKDKVDLKLIAAYQEKNLSLIAQGAEAKIFLTKELSVTLDQKPVITHKPFIKKMRIPKSYRHPTIDNSLRTRRTRAESKLLLKAKEAGINVPQVLATHEYELELEFLDGVRLSETLSSYALEEQEKIMVKLGVQVALLHEQDLIHGDLTTSNTILKHDKVYLIDFGLGFISKKLEDKAVDLHLIKQALEAKHYQNHEVLYEAFLKGYQTSEKVAVLKRLSEVEKRGRHRH